VRRTFGFLALVSFLLVFGGHTRAARAQAAGATVTYPAGTDLVSGPPGTDFSAVDGTLSTMQNGDRNYETVQPADSTKPGFDAPTSLQLAAGSDSPATDTAVAGQWILIGDPSGTLPATVTGANVVYTYDPTNGYQTVTTLQPGQGAWAQGSVSGSITITPETQAALAAAATLKTYDGTGYQVGIPADWDRVSTGQNQSGIDAEWAPSGGQISVMAYQPFAAPAGVPLNPTRILSAVLSDPKFVGSEQISQAPALTTVQGADSAAWAILTGSDPQAGPYKDTIILAIGSQNLYELEIIANTDYSAQNPDLIQQIVQSFQITH
jgi:hypothetical protein